MIVVSVTYPKGSLTFFDLDYYLHKHIPMVQTILIPEGLQELKLLRGTGTLEGTAARYEMTALLSFHSAAEARLAFEKQGQKIMDDIVSFTDGKTQIQVNDVLVAEPK